MFSPRRAPVDRHPLEVEQVLDLGHEGGKSAGVVEVLHQVLAARDGCSASTGVAPGQAVEVVEAQLHLATPRHGDEVDDGVGRAAEGEDHRDGVEKGAPVGDLETSSGSRATISTMREPLAAAMR